MVIIKLNNGQQKSESPPAKHDGFIISPFTVIVDQQEIARYYFQGLHSDSNQQHRPLIVKSITKHLKTGDYSIEGLEHLVTVERKSLEDLYGTLASGRERFAREHERMQAMISAGGYACVVIESSLEDALFDPPWRSRLPPKIVHRTSLSWQIKYGVSWIWASSRRGAEITTFRTLEKFWERWSELC